MNHDDLEEQLRKAIAAGPLEPTATLWDRVAETSRRPKGQHRRRWMLLAGTGIAAGIGGLFALTGVLPSRAIPEARTLVRDRAENQSFFSPAALMAQSNVPIFPLVTNEGPRGLRLKPGSWKYIYIKNEVDTPSAVTYTIRRGQVLDTNAWELTSENSHPRAWRDTDILWVSADSLRPLLRITEPGGVRLEQTFRKDDVLSGYFAPNGYVNWKTTVLTDTSRFNEASIVRWQDLATFFQTTTITSDWKRSLPMSQAAEYATIRPVWLNLKVDGEERLTTPAGTFDCWKLRLAMRLDPPPGVLLFEKGPVDVPDPGITLWVSKDKGWLIQQRNTGGRNGMTSRTVLAEVNGG